MPTFRSVVMVQTLFAIFAPLRCLLTNGKRQAIDHNSALVQLQRYQITKDSVVLVCSI